MRTVGVVDRFEGETVVVETLNGMMQFPLREIPPDTVLREGTVVYIDDEHIAGIAPPDAYESLKRAYYERLQALKQAARAVVREAYADAFRKHAPAPQAEHAREPDEPTEEPDEPETETTIKQPPSKPLHKEAPKTETKAPHGPLR